jgi:L-alanine-DL-glutamate epimerase-like enolase superfamily enzyme
MSVITHITLFPLRIPLKAPFVTSLGALEAVESVIVRITAQDSLLGWG